ncbi:hypothetical protein HNQ77_001383 [Silvibacterium bohemicum]|uniref:Uncharacterized protein n=1 Tax=Silvibacterium bohemicum TaxID=1577686 RepID=A0A841JUK7_9BACT|nr:hypothetical protein [Silvibacterium bohemicum]MBB6143439.1 hypothetical protein [Silvibacterium bohemicum]
MTDKKINHPDADAHKGAVESQSPHDTPERSDLHSNLADQLPHRSGGSDLDGADSDFPEPGSSPEHSGQHK